MICFHPNYNLGDEHCYKDKDEFLFELFEDTLGSDEKAQRKIHRIEKSLCDIDLQNYSFYARAYDNELLKVIQTKHIILPIYLYDHSGLTMNTTGFSCLWDSGQVGWIYADKESVIREYGSFGKTAIENAENRLTSEVKIYDYYLRGESYLINLTKGDKIIDSIGGFLGDYKEVEKQAQDYFSGYILQETNPRETTIKV